MLHSIFRWLLACPLEQAVVHGRAVKDRLLAGCNQCSHTASIVMIKYSISYWGLWTSTAWHGSAFPRALPLPTLAAVATLLLRKYMKEELQRAWQNVDAFPIFVIIVALIIVCRCARHHPACLLATPPARVTGMRRLSCTHSAVGRRASTG